MSSLTSLTGDVSTMCLGAPQQTSNPAQTPSHYGVRDAALFPGYEVSSLVSLPPSSNRSSSLPLTSRSQGSWKLLERITWRTLISKWGTKLWCIPTKEYLTGNSRFHPTTKDKYPSDLNLKYRFLF